MLFVTVSKKCVPRDRLNFMSLMPRRVFLAKSVAGFHPVLSGSRFKKPFYKSTRAKTEKSKLKRITMHSEINAKEHNKTT